MVKEKALTFNGELESQFGKKEVEGSFTVEVFKLHSLFTALENPKYQNELVTVASREELRNNQMNVKDTLAKLYRDRKSVV